MTELPSLRSCLTARDNRVERVEDLSPYAVDLLLEQVGQAAPGAHLAIAIAGDPGDETLARLHRAAVRLHARGVSVRISCAPAGQPRCAPPSA